MEKFLTVDTSKGSIFDYWCPITLMKTALIDLDIWRRVNFHSTSFLATVLNALDADARDSHFEMEMQPQTVPVHNHIYIYQTQFSSRCWSQLKFQAWLLVCAVYQDIRLCGSICFTLASTCLKWMTLLDLIISIWTCIVKDFNREVLPYHYTHLKTNTHTQIISSPHKHITFIPSLHTILWERIKMFPTNNPPVNQLLDNQCK